MGIPPWVWFVAGFLAIAAGAVLLIFDSRRHTSNNRERRRWAALRGWQFAEVDQVLPTRWRYGALAQQRDRSGKDVLAKDIVAGSTFTADGRRQVYVLDLELGSRTTAVLVGVRCRRATPTIVELWLPDMPVPQDTGLDLLGPVGSRYAFVIDVAAARPLITPDVVDALEEIGSDVTVVWLEDDWVMAAIEPNADPARLETLLRELGELADLIDPFDAESESVTAALEEPQAAEPTERTSSTAADQADRDFAEELAALEVGDEVDDEIGDDVRGKPAEQTSATEVTDRHG